MPSEPAHPATPLSLRLHSTLREVLDAIVPALADYAFVHLRDEEGRVREVAVAHVREERELPLMQLLHGARGRITGSDQPVGRALAEGAPQRLEGPTADATFRRLMEGRSEPEYLVPHFLVCLPLKVEGEVMGTLSLARVDSPLRFTDREMKFLEASAAPTALALRNARLVEELAGPIGEPDTAEEEPRVEEEAVAAEEAEEPVEAQAREAGGAEERRPAPEEARRDFATTLRAFGYVAGGIGDAVSRALDTLRNEALLLEIDRTLSPALSEGLDRIVSIAADTGNLVGHLTRLGGVRRSTEQELDVNEAVEGPVRQLEERLGDSFTVERDLSASPSRIRGDAEALRFAVTELLATACEGAPGDGAVRIWTSNEDVTSELAGRYAGRLRAGRYVCVWVEGPGAPPEHDDVDESAEPAPPAATAGDGGSESPSLAIASAVATLFGGHLLVQTEKSGALTCGLYLPEVRSGGQEGGGAEERRIEPVVLVVDSPETDLADVADMLRSAGYPVTRARDRAEAIRVWRAHEGEVSLVVIEADQSAISLVEQLQVIRPDLGVIYTSRALGVEGALWGTTSPRTLFLRRPISRERLLELVEKLLHEPARA